jgi:hypothetical protein
MPSLSTTPGRKFLHEHVGGGGEALQDGPPLARLEVEGDGALVAVEVEELGREPPVPVAERAGVVARFRLLHLDDVGALVGEDHRRPRPRQH